MSAPYLAMRFIGNNKAIKVLERSLQSGRIAQAYFFVGPDKVGKFTLALAFARSLVTGAPLDIMENGQSTQADFDIIILRPEREEQRGVVKEKAITVEHVRDAQQQTATFPNGGRRKVLVVDGADHLTGSAQNALLKTLEEPNSTTVAILIASNRSKIFLTIQSRCQRINFSLVEDSVLEEWRNEYGRDADAECIRGSQGRPGFLAGMLQDPAELDRWKNGMALLRSVMDGGVNSRLDVAERLSKNIPESVELLRQWIWLIRENKNDTARTFARIALIAEGLQLLEETNTNSRLVLENLLLNIA